LQLGETTHQNNKNVWHFLAFILFHGIESYFWVLVESTLLSRHANARNTMFRFFTQNLDAMKKTTNKKKGLSELENFGELKKEEMKSYFGSIKKQTGKKNRNVSLGLFSLDPCEGKLPQ
jgi:hypothetical protein